MELSKNAEDIAHLMRLVNACCVDDLIAEAVVLYKAAIHAALEGKRMAIVDHEGKTLQEVITGGLEKLHKDLGTPNME